MQSNRGHMKVDKLFMKGALIILLAVLAIGLWSPPIHAAAKQTISKVQISDSANSVQIKVTASAPLALHHNRIGSRYVIFDLYGELSASERKRVNINSGGIRFVNCGWYKASPPIARIVVAADGSAQYSVAYAEGKRVAILTVNKLSATAKPQTAVNGSKQPSVSSVSKALSFLPTQTSVAAKPAEISDPAPLTAEEPAVSKAVAAKFRPAPKPITRAKPVLVAIASPVLPTSAPAPKLVSLDFVGSDIHDVLKALSVQGGVNVVASADVKGEVTASLNKVTVDEALKLVANLSGYRYEQRNGAYVVGTSDNLRSLSASNSPTDEKTTAVVILSYSDPVLATKMLEAQYNMVNVSSNASDKNDKEGVKGQTVLVLSGPASSVQSAKAMVEAIENSVGASVSEFVTVLYEIKYADVTELQGLLAVTMPGLRATIGPNQGFKLQCPNPVAMGTESSTAPQGAQGAAAQTAQPKMLILQGSQADIDRAKEFLAQIDIPQQQIVIEAKVIDITDDASKDLGIEWGDDSGFASDTLTEIPGSGLNIGKFTRVGLSIPLSIKALIDDNKAKVLANPNVLALDGKPSSIFIGDEIKYVVSRDISSTTGKTTITTETARVGVQLHTISRVSPDDFITMDLHPEVSVVKSFLDAGDGILLPQISRRFVDSTVRVKNGETIVIGGLIKDDEIKSISGIPLLKDLPLIGELFKSRRTSKIHSEVMMFITPRIVAGS